MPESTIAANVIFGIGTVIVAALVAIVVGRRRGLDQIEARADGELKKLVDAQQARLALLEAENRRLTAEVDALRAKVQGLEADLRMEKAITLRMRADGAA